MLGLLQRFIDKEIDDRHWEAEELPASVSDAYRTLESLREKQIAGNLGSNAHDFTLLNRAQNIVRQWESDNNAPAIEIPVVSEGSEVGSEVSVDSSPERPLPELDQEPETLTEVGAEASDFLDMFVPSRSRPVPHMHTHSKEDDEFQIDESEPQPSEEIKTHQVFVAGIIADEFRPMPKVRVDESRYNDNRIQEDSDEQRIELNHIREGIRAARAELELLEHRLSALVNSNS